MTTSNTTSPASEVHIIEPETHPHTHTAVFLHGRGSTAKEFADDLLALPLASGQTLSRRLPGWRLVFPSSREVWSTVFQEFMPAWFEDASSSSSSFAGPISPLGPEGKGADPLASSLRDSVRRLGALLDDEIARLGGDARRLAIVGISQGAAVGLWALLGSRRLERRLGAFVGASGWLPFADDVSRFLRLWRREDDENQSGGDRDEAGGFVGSTMTSLKCHLPPISAGSENLLSTPVLLCHGTDDAYVDVELGREARTVLTALGMRVAWKEYSGAEQEGHWFKEPEEVDDIVDFLVACMSEQSRVGIP